MDERGINSQRNAKITFRPKSTLRRAQKTLSYIAINYMGKGTTKEVKRLRKIYPISHHKVAQDYKFHTRFEHDFFESVILTRKKQLLEAW
jgi:hypothetical protein